MKYIIPDIQTEPFRPHELGEEDWQVLKEVAGQLKVTMNGREAYQLYKRWINDRLLHPNPVKPLIFYATVSNLIKHRRIKIRKEEIDPRIPLLLYMPSGSGKRIILEALYDLNKGMKSILRKKISNDEQFARIIGKRFSLFKKQKITAEALLGTIYGHKGEDGELVWMASMGAFGTDATVVINEASIFFQADNENMKNVFPYVCEALDPIGSKANEVAKQLTGKPPLWYATETNFILFCQPDRANVDMGLITSGTLPRFVIAYSPVSDQFQREVFEYRLSEEEHTSKEDTLRLVTFLVSLFKEDRNFVLHKDAINQMRIEMEALEKFASREKAAGVYLTTSYQRIVNIIFKMASVNCACRYDYIIRKEDVETAASDYRSAFMTAMVFFVSQNIRGLRINDRQYLLMLEIEGLWGKHGKIIRKELLMETIKDKKEFQVTEKTIRNMLGVLHSGRFIYWDRGTGPKIAYIIDPSIPKDEIRNVVLSFEEKENGNV